MHSETVNFGSPNVSPITIARLADARQPNNMSAVLFLQGVINLSQIYSLNSAIPPSKNFSYTFQELARSLEVGIGDK